MKHCLICDSKEEFAFTKLGYELRRCSNCDLFRTVMPQPYAEMLKTYYNRGYF